MSSAAILSKRTYTRGAVGAQTRTLSLQLNAKRAVSGLLVSFIASISALANRTLVDQSSALGVVLNMGTSEIVNKIFILRYIVGLVALFRALSSSCCKDGLLGCWETTLHHSLVSQKFLFITGSKLCRWIHDNTCASGKKRSPKTLF